MNWEEKDRKVAHQGLSNVRSLWFQPWPVALLTAAVEMPARVATIPGDSGTGLAFRTGFARMAAGAFFAARAFAATFVFFLALAAGLVLVADLAGAFAARSVPIFLAGGVLMLSPPDRMAADAPQTDARQSPFPVSQS
jgi:hypothetical protein